MTACLRPRGLYHRGIARPLVRIDGCRCARTLYCRLRCLPLFTSGLPADSRLRSGPANEPTLTRSSTTTSAPTVPRRHHGLCRPWDEEIVSACEVSIAFYPSMGGRERSQEGDRRPGGAVKDPVATRDFHVELVAVPTLSKLQLRSVALHHSSPWRGWVKRTSWSIDTPCFDWHFHLQTYAGCSRPLVSSEEHQMALSRGTS